MKNYIFVALSIILCCINSRALTVYPEDIMIEEFKNLKLMSHYNSVDEALLDEHFEEALVVSCDKNLKKEFEEAFPQLTSNYKTTTVDFVDPSLKDEHLHLSLYGVFDYYKGFIPLYEELGCQAFNTDDILFVKNGLWIRFCFEEFSSKLHELTGVTSVWGGTLIPGIKFNDITAMSHRYGAIYQFYSDLKISIYWPDKYKKPDSSLIKISDNPIEDDNIAFDISGKRILLNSCSDNHKGIGKIVILQDKNGNTKKTLIHN